MESYYKADTVSTGSVPFLYMAHQIAKPVCSRSPCGTMQEIPHARIFLWRQLSVTRRMYWVLPGKRRLGRMFSDGIDLIAEGL